MNLIATIELVALFIALAGVTILLAPRERRRQGPFGPILLALLVVAALLHLFDYLEWRGNASADRLGDMVRIVIPMLWLALAFDAYRSARAEESANRVEQFRLILEQTNLPTILIDEHGQILDCSDSFLFRSSRLREELVGRRVRDVGSLPRAAIEEAWKRALDSDGAVGSPATRSVIWAGEEEMIDWVAQRWLDPATGKPAGASVVLSIAETARTAAEEKAEAEAQTQAFAAPEAERAARKNEPDRAAAHDLANFLQIITGQAELLAFDLDIQHRQRALSISQAGRTAFELVRALATPGRREPLRRSPVDLVDLLGSTVTLLEPTLPPNVRLLFENLAEHPVVLGDRVRLQRVLVNLILNAKDAMPRGGAIVVRLGVRDCEAKIQVLDEGQGIDEETRERIFERYFTTKPAGQGSGVGLTLAREILREHGGDVQLVRTSESGSEFLLTLPLTVEEHIEF